MNTRWLGLMAPIALITLTGCLEVEQHPTWHNAQYNGKPDPRHDQALFHGDRLAWYAAIDNRTQRQNEYNRTPERGGPP